MCSKNLFRIILGALFLFLMTNAFAQQPDLIVKEVKVSTASTQDYIANLDGPTIKYSFTIRNQGSGAAAAGYKIRVYLSTNSAITQSDYFIAEFERIGTPLGAGDEDPYTNRTTTIKWDLAKGIPNVPNGTYYLGVIVDYNNVIAESNEGNNTNYDPARTILVQYPDLQVTAVGRSISGRIVTITATIRNNQPYVCNKPYQINFYLSNNTAIEKTDYLLGTWAGPNLAGNFSMNISASFDASSVSDGVYYVGAIIDANDQIIEHLETNNTKYDGSNRVIFMVSPGFQPYTSGTMFNAGSTFYVYIRLGIGIKVTNILGLSGTLEYSHKNFIDFVPGSFYYNYSSGLGSSSDVIANHMAEEPVGEPGKIHFSICRMATKGGKDISGGYGVESSNNIARFQLKSIASTPAGTPVEFSLRDVKAIDPSGNLIPLQIFPWSIIIKASTDKMAVWPGDTNNDGFCNMQDLLPIGIYWGKVGPNRTCHSAADETKWIEHTVYKTRTTPAPTISWDPWQAAAFADADGNGSIGTNDLNTLNLNKGKTHDLPMTQLLALSKLSIQGMLRPITNNSILTPNQEFAVDFLAENMEDLFGMAFDLKYPSNSNIEVLSIEPGSWLGEDVLVLFDIDKTAGIASVAISRKSGQESLQGSGIVARIKMKTLANFAPTNAIQLDLENIVANDQDGITYTLAKEALCLSGFSNFQNSGTPEEFKLHANYPNPFNPITTISYTVAKHTHVKLTVYNTLGQVVAVLVNELQAQGSYSVAWDAQNQSSGLYICRFEADGFTATKKMFLQK